MLESLREAVLDAPEDWDAMRVLADWHEDEGDLVTASGWRWLADNRRRPYKAFGSLHTRHWYEADDEQPLDPESDLPTKLFATLSGALPYDSATFRYYENVAEAFDDFLAAWRKLHA